MITEYMNQAVIWKAKGAVNDSNEPTYAADATIACRFEYKRRLVRNKTGEQVISEARLFTESPVKPDDLITFDSIDWVVIAVANQPDLDGTVLFYEVNM
jgi:hypothetical protein